MQEYKIIEGYKNYQINTLGQIQNIKSNRILKIVLITKDMLKYQ